MIEYILIEIYNHNIGIVDKKTIHSDLDNFKLEIIDLCKKNGDAYNCHIVKILLQKIKELIGRYKVKIFEINEIRKLRDSVFRSKILRNKTPKQYPKTNKTLSNYMSKFSLPFPRTKHYYILKSSTPQTNEQKKFNTIQTIFEELRNIKRSLLKSSDEIEKIFKYPKKKFKNFSIDKCQREEYLNTLIDDDFIQYLINENKEEDFNILINEIEEDRDKNITEMTDYLNYIDSICINGNKDESYISIKEEIDEIVNKKVPIDLDDLVKFIESSEIKKPKKKKKKVNKKPLKESELYQNVNEKNDTNDNEILKFKFDINKNSIYSYKTQKIKTNFSQEWLNNLNQTIKNYNII